jgi:hypothetical protein
MKEVTNVKITNNISFINNLTKPALS